MDFYGVGHRIPLEDRPSIILSAETDLGITAGLQDRVIQVCGLQQDKMADTNAYIMISRLYDQRASVLTILCQNCEDLCSF